MTMDTTRTTRPGRRIAATRILALVSAVSMAGAISAMAAVSMAGQGSPTPPAGDAAAATSVAPSAGYQRGKLLYIQCRACHDLKPSPLEKVGPNLSGLLNRPAAQDPDFAYSAALAKSQLVWDRATLDRWLTRPGELVPGNTMAFAGIASPADRAALIAYLELETRTR